MRRIARIDGNQPEIVNAFRKLGCSVQHLHKLGQGCPDILVGYMDVNLLAEIKDGTRIPSERKLTKDESEWFENWRGQICIVESVSDAIDLIHEVVMRIKQEHRAKHKGNWIDKKCPRCNHAMIGNLNGDEWCGSMTCTYGLDDFKDDVELNVQPK